MSSRDNTNPLRVLFRVPESAAVDDVSVTVDGDMGLVPEDFHTAAAATYSDADTLINNACLAGLEL
jgi:hypothetical protein